MSLSQHPSLTLTSSAVSGFTADRKLKHSRQADDENVPPDCETLPGKRKGIQSARTSSPNRSSNSSPNRKISDAKRFKQGRLLQVLVNEASEKYIQEQQAQQSQPPSTLPQITSPSYFSTMKRRSLRSMNGFRMSAAETVE